MYDVHRHQKRAILGFLLPQRDIMTKASFTKENILLRLLIVSQVQFNYHSGWKHGNVQKRHGAGGLESSTEGARLSLNTRDFKASHTVTHFLYEGCNS